MTIELQLHPGEEVLERYSLGHLIEDDLVRVEEHLFVCEQCQEQLVHVEQFIAEMKTACQDFRLQPVPAPWWSRLSEYFAVPRLAYAGAVAALAITVLVPVARHQPEGSATADTVTWNVTYRGAETGVVEARAKHPLHLVMNIADLKLDGTYRVTIVNRDGKTVWTGNPQIEGTKLVVLTTEQLAAGIYWVRLFEPDGSPNREFGLQLH